MTEQPQTPKLIERLAETARHLEVPWSPERAQRIKRGLENRRRTQQRRRRMLPVLAAVGLFVTLLSVASWASWDSVRAFVSTVSFLPWRGPVVVPKVRDTALPRRPLARSASVRPVVPEPASMPPAPTSVDGPEPDTDPAPPLHPAPAERPGQAQKGRGPRHASAPPASSPPVEPAALVAPPPPAPPPPIHDWRALAHNGQFEEAYEQAYRRGEVSGEVVGAAHSEAGEPRGASSTELSAVDLLLLADVARLSHHAALAVPSLERLLRSYAGDPRAPLAAFTLGRVLLDDLGRPREAAEAFRRAQLLEKQGSDGPLAQDALAREVEAWSHAGEQSAAHERALEYVKRYPSGRRLRSVRHYGDLD